MLPLNHNCADHEAPNDFDPLPVGKYQVIITEGTQENTKAMDGKYLKLKLQIVGDAYANRVIFCNLNLWNKSEQACQIARGTLTQIGNALNTPVINDISELLNKRLTVDLKTREWNGEIYNEVKSFSASDLSMPVNETQPSEAPPTQVREPTTEVTDDPPF